MKPGHLRGVLVVKVKHLHHNLYLGKDWDKWGVGSVSHQDDGQNKPTNESQGCVLFVSPFMHWTLSVSLTSSPTIPSPVAKLVSKSWNMDESFPSQEPFSVYPNFFLFWVYAHVTKKKVGQTYDCSRRHVRSFYFIQPVLGLPPTKYLPIMESARNKSMNETWYLSSGNSQTTHKHNYNEVY